MTADSEMGNEVPGQNGGPGVVLFGGWVLYEVLMRVLRVRGDDEAKLCAALCVTKGFLNMIATGMRPANSLSDDFFRSCATYLCVPQLLVQIVAGRISELDLVELGTYAGNDMGRVMGAARELTMSMKA